MNGILFHTLKGIKGWGELCISTIDVNKITHIYNKKRLFCIFNKDHPYNLTIKYYEPKESYSLAPGISFYGGITASLVKEVQLIAYITKRYKTEIEVQNEIKEIKMKQQKIELFTQKIRNQIEKDEIK